MQWFGVKVLASELTGVNCLGPLLIPRVCKLTGIVCLPPSRSRKRRRDPHNKHHLVPNRRHRLVQSLWHHLGLHIADHQVQRTWHRPAPRTVVPLVLRSRPPPGEVGQEPATWVVVQPETETATAKRNASDDFSSLIRCLVCELQIKN